MIDAARTVEWTPAHYGKRMEDWLNNMGDWCISRKRYWGLPLPFYECAEGHLTVVGSKDELVERATQGIEGLEELHRPWIDPVRIRCSECEAEAERVPEVGDCWLDAGIIPFSTLGYQRDAYLEGGFAAGAGEGLTQADLPDNAYWERWFPADWVSEMREQIRLWFYSQLFMSVALTGKAPYRAVLGYEKLNDETGRPMHKSWGNAIWFDDAIEKIGADVMRWMFAAQAPGQNMSFGYGPADAVRRRLHPLWNSYRFLSLNAAPEGFRPDPGRARARAALRAPARPLAARARAGARARRARGARPLRRRPSTCAPASASSTTSRTGTCAARAPASGRATGWRSRCCTTRSSASRAWSRPRCRSSPRSCGRASSSSRSATPRPTRCTSPASPRSTPSCSTSRCSSRWRTRAPSSSSATRPAPRRASACASRSPRRSSRAPTPPRWPASRASPTRSRAS